MSMNNLQNATIRRIVKPVKTKEGIGATVQRLIGIPELLNFDPFLMMDHFKGRLPGGFPDHPHRGFETITYLLAGQFMHEDCKGHKVLLKPGDVQWMTAGKGILHAEMPGSAKEDSIGFQIWLNLPKEKKMCEPSYQEFSTGQIPANNNQKGVSVKVICGNEMGVEGAVKPNWPVQLVEFTMAENSKFNKLLPIGWNCMVYLYEGSLQVGEESVQANSGVFFDLVDENRVARFKTNDEKPAKFMFLGGKPIGEPIVQQGPFVMNTHEEIEQAISDYQLSQNGFENSATWKSGIRKLSFDFSD